MFANAQLYMLSIHNNRVLSMYDYTSKGGKGGSYF